jgi:hypothetical protein
MVMHLLAPWVKAIVNVKKEDGSLIDREAHDYEI